MMRRILLTLLLVSTFASQSLFAQTAAIKITPAEKKIAEAITAKQLSDYLHFVASDEMEGRDTPSRGLDTTAKFIGMNLSRWGFKPAGDNGTFYQKFALRNETVDPSLNVLKVGDTTFTMFDDYFRLQGDGKVDAPMVFVRDGWMVKAKGIDAYKGIDVKDKIIVIFGNGFPRGDRATSPPAGVTEADLKGTKGTDWADPMTYARQSGAKGVILIGSPQAQGAWSQIKGFFSRGNMQPDKLRTQTTETSMPVMLVSNKVADAIFAGESANKDSAAPFALTKSVSITSAAKIEMKSTQNVVAIWEGSDPILKKEMVAVGAHYDHVGVNLNAPGPDKIWNGADDDGSGTVGVLAIAEALAKSSIRPKRSILFVWHAGEEKGLWGSEIFNKFPTVDIKQVIAQLNVDMIGRSKAAGDTNPKNKDLSGPTGIYVIGSEMMSSTMGAVVKGTNDAYMKLGYDYRYDDPKDPNRFFYRSDHFNYAVNGIPIAFWFDGEHEDYHGAGDHPDKIDYAKMEMISRTIFLTMWELSDLKVRPKVDKQLPPELTQR